MKNLASIFGPAAVALVGLSGAEAQACGGFFCSAASPVNQAAERIIFAQDSEGMVTQIVEVMYEGDAEKFAWVLPVPGKPEPGVSSVQALDRLQQATNPSYGFRNTFPDGCTFPAAGASSSITPGTAIAFDSAESAKVTVIDAGTVGPFNYETISVDAGDTDPADVAVAWLSDNDYDLGDQGAEVLRPYLENGLNLIAFKLVKGKSAGSIRPITLKYQAKSMAIPILPTAVAAQDNMPILVWVLGESRAVSTNYRGLEINELLIDWFNATGTYNDVVSAAADEADGQGFVTEFAGLAAPYEVTIAPSWQSLENISLGDDSLEQALVQLTNNLGSFDGYADALSKHVVFRDGYTALDFISCASCYFENYFDVAGTEGIGQGGAFSGGGIPEDDPIFQTDREALLAAIQEGVLSPIEDTAALFAQHTYLTRLYTTMSAEEMNKDPLFDFNADLEDVSNQHFADRLMSCEGSSWVATLASGEKVYGDGNVWPHSLNDELLPVNSRVLQFSTSGAPEVLVDNGVSIQSTHRETVAGTEPTPAKKSEGGCAYNADPRRSPGGTFGFLALGALLALGRRRLALGKVRRGNS